MADMMTEDGRIVSIPDGLVGQFRGLTPAPTPPVALPPPLPTPSFAPAELAALTPPPEPASAAPPAPASSPLLSEAGPVTSPSQVGAPASTSPRGPVTSPAEDVGTPNPPKPITNRDIATMGEAGPLNAELGANQSAKEAAQRLGTAMADQATAMGAIETHANDIADRQLAEIKQTAEVNAKAVQDATDQYVQNAKRLADVRIDHGVDHPVVAAIATALNILGTAMKKGDMSQVMKPIYDAVDRKVAAQMQDIELGKANLGLQRESIAMMRQQGSDKVGLQNTLMLAGLEQAKRRVQEIKDKSMSPIIKAQSDQAMADIDGRMANAVGSAQQRFQQRQEAAAARAQAERIAKAQIAVTMRGQDIQQYENEAARKERAQEHIDSIAKDLLIHGNSAAEARAKAVKDTGILDPVTHEYMLTTEGQKKMAEADSVEAQIRKDPVPVAKAYISKIQDKDTQLALETKIRTDPKAAAQLAQQYADSIRADAQINNAALVRGAIPPKEIQEKVSKAHEVTLALDDAQKMLEKGPGAFDRSEWAKINAQLMVANAKYVATLGERVSVKALEAFNGVMAIDPNDEGNWGANGIFSRVADKGKAIEAIKALKQAAAKDADAALGSAGIKADWKPGTPESNVTNEFGGKTVQELADDNRPASKTWMAIAGTGAVPDMNEVGQDAAIESAAARRGKSGKTSNYGLDPDVDDHVRELAKQSESVGHKKYADIVESLARPIAEGNRPGLDVGVAKLLRDTKPSLLSDVMAKVATDAGAQRAQEIASLIQSRQVPAPVGALTPQARNDLAVQQTRGKLGLPSGTYTEPPDNWRAMTDAQKQKHNAWLESNGFPPVKL